MKANRRARRCSQCGHRFSISDDITACPFHPDAPLYDWSPGTGNPDNPVRIAYWVICAKSRTGIDLDAYVEEAPAIDLAGTNANALAEALTLARRWQDEDEFYEGRLPPVYSSKGLFG